MDSPPSRGSGAPSDGDRRSSTVRYFLAVALTVTAILSQYWVPQRLPSVVPLYQSFLGGLVVVYGVPLAAFSLLVGTGPLRAYRQRMALAGWEGLRWYGIVSVLAFAVSFALLVVYAAVDPAALKLLNRPNPVLQQAASDPWFAVVFSFVIGAVEEVIFRGWIFGYWLGRGRLPWSVHAAWTSVLFAAVHLYYAQTYGVASPILYPTLFLVGFGFAATVRATGGNLVVVALLHGGTDAAAFLTLVSVRGAIALHYGVILVGAALAVVQYFRGSPFSPRGDGPTVAPPAATALHADQPPSRPG
jgi:membrane protease YdiL (CAAX protease family)